MLRNLGAPEIIIIALLIILIFGWKRLPDAARSLGRSARVFKSEVDEMKRDNKSAAASETVPGETVNRTSEPDAPATGERPRTDTTPQG
jgi:sec-independent protein translocase protein TatA